MNVILFTTDKFLIEKKYVFNYVFTIRLGINFEIKTIEEPKNYFQIINQEGKSIFIADSFFSHLSINILDKSSLPNKPLSFLAINDEYLKFKLKEESIPLIFGNSSNILLEKDNFINLDIFGSIFFLLTGYEEIIIKDTDEFNNFPYKKSILSHNNLISRPLVDEYITILSHYLQRNLNIFPLKDTNFKIIPTHDVDRAFKYYEASFTENIKESLIDIIKRKSIKTFIQRNKSYLFNGKGDPFNTYDWLIEQSEKRNLQSIFYFKNHLIDNEKDVAYNIKSKALKNIFLNIDKKGHVIGFHPSYETYTNYKLMLKEAQDFREYLLKLNVKQEISHIRQHYLRYQNPTTSEIQSKIGFSFDSTIGFLNKIGFRRGTCHPFPIFNLTKRFEMNLIEYPLIVMDITLFTETDKWEDRYDLVFKIISKCKQFKGNFIFLWHNEYLYNEELRYFYLSILNIQ